MAVAPPATTAGPARMVLQALNAGAPKLFVAGGIGTGKSTALEAVRRTLRDAGHTVVSRGWDPGDDRYAVVVDDAHLLDDTELRALTELAGEPGRTLVVAAEPREQAPALRALCSALEREHPRITLEPLSSGEISHALADQAGHPPSAQLLASALRACAGLPLLAGAIARSPRPLSEAGVGRAVELALIDRLRRLEQTDLESLLIASLTTELGAADLAAALGVADGTDLIDRVRATGLVTPAHTGEFLNRAHRAATQLVGASRHHELEKCLLRTQLASGTLGEHLAVELAGHGVRDEALADALRGLAAGCHGEPTARARLHRAAVEAGADDLKAGLADALALAGDTAPAAVLADELLTSDVSAERAAGVRIAAGIAAGDGNYTQAAELFGWLGPYSDAVVGSAGAVVHAGVGDLGSARAALQSAQTGPPTASARAARNLAEAVVLTLDGPYSAAAVKLGQSAAADHPPTLLLPDSGPALVTLAAIHSGDAARARSVIGRAVRHPETAFVARHRLLQAWVRMQDGQLSAASADADALGTAGLGRRDALWAAALRTSIARRSGDAGALHTQWLAGMDIVAEYSVDLFSLLPLGELWMAGARLRQADRLTPALEQGFGVLRALDEPVAWAPLLHWAGVQAGILAGDPALVAPHGQALTAMAEHSPFAAALAAGGRCWLRVLAGQVDAEEVAGAARGLAGFGLTSDATRLAGQAALQAADAKVAGLMLQVARDLKLSTGEITSEDPGPGPARRPRPAPTALSDREREVAELLLLGMPYRDIGAQLFISAKTVEHHVARIRRRLGAESRTEMLSMLRAMLSSGIGETAVSEF